MSPGKLIQLKVNSRLDKCIKCYNDNHWDWDDHFINDLIRGTLGVCISVIEQDVYDFYYIMTPLGNGWDQSCFWFIF